MGKDIDIRIFTGYLDEVRVSKGVARWTSNFTPPTTSYTNFISPYATHLYTFDTSSYENLTKLNIDLLASATANAGNGVTAKIWNKNTLAWVSLASLTNTSATMPGTVATQSLTSSLTDYVDASGIVRVLVYATNPSASGTNAVLSADYVKLSVWGDLDIPDIVSVDAGASNLDRVSLTNDTWFNNAATGNDAILSFTWTDPASISDDTFYYELNTTATETIDGTESTTTNIYIDSIAIAEGTSYFHVKPKNGAGTWGTERIFIVKYDTIAPLLTTISVSSDKPNYLYDNGVTASGGTIYFNSTTGEGAGQIITLTATATETNPDGWSCATAFADTPTKDTTSAYTQTYSVEAGAANQSNVVCTFTDLAGNTDTATFNFLADNAGPLHEAAGACGTSAVTDADGNVYNTVEIGDQCWLKENLRTTKYPNGTAITKGPATHGGGGWTTDAGLYSCPPNATNDGEDCSAASTLGMLYQWSAAMNGSTGASAQGICMAGWHIPTHSEWTALERAVCTSGTCTTDFPYDTTTTGWRGTDEGSKLSSQTLNGNNSSGFTALLAGSRSTASNYGSRGTGTNVWSSSESGSSAWRRYMDVGSSTVVRSTGDKTGGFSVRCVADSPADTFHIMNKAWGENTGWITLNGGDYGIVIDGDTRAITGKAWNENTGWINFDNPTNTLALSASGAFTGNVWSENMGWLSFSGTGYSVSIDAQGVLSGQAWNENSGWITFSPDANNNVTTAWLPDTAPNHGTAVNGPEARDTDTGSSLLTNSLTVNLFWNATDAISGIVAYLVRESAVAPTVDDASWQSATPTTFTLSIGDATKTLYFWLLDAVGNISDSQTTTITLDATAPVITITDDANGSWNTSDTIVATITDTNLLTTKWDYDADGTCSAIAGDYANVYTSGNSLTVNTTHNDYICFYAEDTVGNKTTSATTQLKVDLAAPTITNVTTSSPACETIRFTVNGAADALSGLSATAYSFDGGTAWQAESTKDYSGTSQTLVSGQIKVRDAAGNIYTYNSDASDTASSCNVAPNIPTLVSPANASSTSDSTPTLSANYSDSDIGDVGTTNYRIATSSVGCLDNSTVVSSGTSATTTTNSEATTWTPGSSIGIDGTYYWCAQNNDGALTSDWTSMGNFTLDTATPDIVAVDAGASNLDRVSLTSDTWFNNAATGNDAALSFTWTDPASPSDDTFYYELNTTATETIDGTETSTTDNFIDGIAITEGISYFHVKPKNGAGTWGAERIFIVKYDTTAPTLDSKTTFSGWYTTNQTSTFTYTDASSGIASGNNPTCSITTEGASQTCDVTPNVCDNAGNCNTTLVTSNGADLDKTAPTVQLTTLTSPNGSENWGGLTERAITWTAADFTDPQSALITNPITLAYTTNGTDWTPIATNEANDGIYTWTTPNLTSATVKVRITAENNAGLTSSDTSDANFSLTSTTNANTLLITSGDNQLGSMNTALGDELLVRVTNGFDVGVANVDVTFTIATIPTTPDATGQVFGNGTLGTHINNTATTRTMRTDADGYASVVFALGDRAGDYTVTTDFSGNTSGIKTFTATEKEYFQLTFDNTALTADLNPANNTTATKSLTLTITTNAVSYEITTLPDMWPTRTEGAGTLANWDGTKGFGWDNNDDVTTTTAFATNAGNPDTTVVFSCSGDTCQTTKTPTLDFTTVIDYTSPAGIYTNQISLRGAVISY